MSDRAKSAEDTPDRVQDEIDTLFAYLSFSSIVALVWRRELITFLVYLSWAVVALFSYLDVSVIRGPCASALGPARSATARNYLNRSGFNRCK